MRGYIEESVSMNHKKGSIRVCIYICLFEWECVVDRENKNGEIGVCVCQ